MAVIQMDESYLLGGWFASALWGGYTVLFGTSLFLILAHKRHELRRATTWIMCLMYALATVHVFLALRRIVVALIVLQNKPPGPIPYLANIGDPLNRAKDLIYITNLILGDSVITWRCYAVWGGNLWVVSLPVVMIVGTAIGGYGAIHQYFLAHPSLETSVAWGTAMFSLSLATNIVVTGLTAGRIWYITRPKAFSLPGSTSGPPYAPSAGALMAPSRRYRTIVLLVIESGAVIAVAKTIEFAFFKTAPLATFGNHTLYIVFDMMPQITGIMPTLIILAVNAGLTSTSTYMSDPPSRASASASASLPTHAGARVLALGTHLSFRTRGAGDDALDTFGTFGTFGSFTTSTTTRGSEHDMDLKEPKRRHSAQGVVGRKAPETGEPVVVQ